MDILPVSISVPHSGLSTPPELEGQHLLSDLQIKEDGDVGAWEIYSPLKDLSTKFISATIARAFIDLNRSRSDIRRDGVIKTHTCWDEKIYYEELNPELIKVLLDRYHLSYHKQLESFSNEDILLSLDCHTMASKGPSVAPDANSKRPNVCIGDGKGLCPPKFTNLLVDCFRDFFPGKVTLNTPFSGGYITQHHGRNFPWIQIEINRHPFATDLEKSEWVIWALKKWCSKMTKEKAYFI